MEEIEKIINYYFVIISSVNNQMMIELGNKLYECERKYNYLDIELKPFSKFVKNKFNYPFLKSKMNVIKNNYQQLENAVNNKILNNIVNEEKEKLLPNNEKETKKWIILLIYIIFLKSKWNAHLVKEKYVFNFFLVDKA